MNVKQLTKTDVLKTFFKFDFFKFKILFQGQFLGSSNSRRYQWILKLFVVT